MSIQRKLPIVFAIVVALLAAMVVLLDRSERRQVENASWVAHTEEVIAQLAGTRGILNESETAASGYLISGEKRYTDIRQRALAALQQNIERLVRLTADNPDQFARAARLRDAVRNQVENSSKLIELRQKQGSAKAASALSAIDPQRGRDVIRLLDEMASEEHALLAKRETRLQSSNVVFRLASAASGVLILVLLVMADILFKRDASQRKSLETQLVQKNAELETASRLKSEFLADMSHELRTPLNAVIGYTGTLLMRLPGPLTADQEKQLRIIQSSAHHLLSLINDLLDLAKIESGKVNIQLEKLSCQEIIEQVILTLRPLAQAKSIEFRASLPSAPVVAKTDRRAFSQILINLANNAIKFTQEGSVRLELCERNDNERGMAAIDIIDTGIGIRPADHARLFRAFEQLESRKTQAQGTGLGLYVSGRLAALIGGRIFFESEYGKGSRFTLLVPKS